MSVRELFERLRGREVAVLTNEGNCGDGLIDRGLRRLLREYGIAPTFVQYPLPLDGDTLLILANGDLCATFHSLPIRAESYLQSFRQTYVLPCSIDATVPEVESFLRGLPATALFFCRERYSFASAKFLFGGTERVHLDHDLAFSFDYRPWLREGSGRLNAFRTDGESIGGWLPSDNIDVSSFGGYLDGDRLLDTISKYAMVYTDRAHVAICAAMLGKVTHIFPNGYHKVRGIYEYSLRDLPNVTFHPVNDALTAELIA